MDFAVELVDRLLQASFHRGDLLLDELDPPGELA